MLEGDRSDLVDRLAGQSGHVVFRLDVQRQRAAGGVGQGDGVPASGDDLVVLEKRNMCRA